MSRWFSIESPLMTGLTKLADLIIVNLIAIVCCLPIITIGASMTALNYVVIKIVRNEESYIIKAFFRSFKQNFRQATVITLIFLVIGIIFGFDYMLIYNYMKAGGDFPFWMRVGLIAVTALTFALFIHVFPLLSKFDNTIGKTLKNSVLVSLMIWPKTLLEFIIWIAPTALFIFFPQIMPLLILLGLSGPAWLCAKLYNKNFMKLEPEVEEKDPDSWTLDPLESDSSIEKIEETEETEETKNTVGEPDVLETVEETKGSDVEGEQ